MSIGRFIRGKTSAGILYAYVLIMNIEIWTWTIEYYMNTIIEMWRETLILFP